MERKLVRINDVVYKVCGGVCAGIAYYFGVSIWLVRILFVLFGFFTGLISILYLIFWFRLPDIEIAPKDFEERTAFKWPWSTK